MKFLKKNQVIVAVIGLMLMVAGYLNFTNQEGNNIDIIETGTLADAEEMAGIGDATLVSTIPTETEKLTNETLDSKTEVEEDEKYDSNEIQSNNEINMETSATNTVTSTNEYFNKSRLERETMYSKEIETYQKMMEKMTISETQKQTAQNEINRIYEEQNAVMITENLLKTKGFEDLIIFVNGDSINIIVKAKQLEKEQIAQIQNIITRELKADIENIHITNKE